MTHHWFSYLLWQLTPCGKVGAESRVVALDGWHSGNMTADELIDVPKCRACFLAKHCDGAKKLPQKNLFTAPRASPVTSKSR